LEQQQLAALREPDRTAQFYRLFTQKEAFLKTTDKRWPLVDSSFCLTGGQWCLNTHQADYTFHLAESAGYFVAACLQMPSFYLIY
jgi:4'-phosphopantetheinyl transferase